MNLEIARKQMVEQQIRAWEVLDDRVLGALAQVKRELFVPPAWRDLAFADAPVPLPRGQSMLPPKIDGRILQALELSPSDAVLDVGTGSGFLAGCLTRLAGSVRSVEIYPDLAERAAENLRAAGIGGVELIRADALLLEDRERYDAIAVTGSLPIDGGQFQQALKIGGRLFVFIGDAPAMTAWLLRRVSPTQWLRQSLFETVVEPLVNAPQPPRFVF